MRVEWLSVGSHTPTVSAQGYTAKSLCGARTAHACMKSAATQMESPALSRQPSFGFRDQVPLDGLRRTSETTYRTGDTTASSGGLGWRSYSARWQSVSS